MISPNTPVEELVERARAAFRAEYAGEPTTAVCAPGRINLIGEHTDYNDGFVLPMALPLVTVIVGAYNGTADCRLLSVPGPADEEARVSFVGPGSGPLRPGQPTWANYVKGVVANFPVDPFAGEVKGFDAVVVTSVPMGGGVSSSAALEVATFTFLEALTGNKYDSTAKALACQKAEHQFAGMPCGIMDQFISVMGKKDNALLIDCESLESTLIPLTDDNVVILITNSNVKHRLTGSEYPLRRSQCQNAASLLGKVSLRAATIDDIEELKRLNADQTVIRRARHVITEIARTEEAATALKKGDYKRVGELFYDSHDSLRDLFEVSCPELDILVEAAQSVEGVLGSRMTGGGFGGCTVTLVYKHAVNNLVEAITKKYTGKPDFYVVRPSDGARVLSL